MMSFFYEFAGFRELHKLGEFDLRSFYLGMTEYIDKASHKKYHPIKLKTF